MGKYNVSYNNSGPVKNTSLTVKA